MAAFIKSKPEEAYADLQISFRPVSFTYHVNGVVKVDPVPSVAASVCRLRPAATGMGSLQSGDAAATPLFHPDFLTHPEDVAAVIQDIRAIRRIMAMESMADRVIEESPPGGKVQTDEQILAFIRMNGDSAYHPAGTCKMGNEATAVVGDQLRVRGVQGLRVIDASIMLNVTSGNTNAPTMMIGEKGPDMALQDSGLQGA